MNNRYFWYQIGLYILAGIASFMIVYWASGQIERNMQNAKDAAVKAYKQQQKLTPDDWQLFKQALIEVESEGIEDTKGKDMDYGVLQITPIYVDEVNRILGESRYTHNDALDSLKSLEMFEVIQGKRNPNKDLKTALMLHNSNAMNEHTMSYYEYKVMYNFYKLKCEWYERD